MVKGIALAGNKEGKIFIKSGKLNTLQKIIQYEAGAAPHLMKSLQLESVGYTTDVITD